jgi:6-phosphogluconolactonase
MKSKRMMRAKLGGIAVVLFGIFSAAAFAAPEPFYLGTYTDTSGSKGIYAGTLDSATGALGPFTLAAAGPDPSYLALSPDGRALYAAEETPGSGSVEAWQRNADGKLTPLDRVPSSGRGTCFVSVDPSGRDVLISNYGSGSDVCFHVRPDGSLGARTAFLALKGSGPNRTRQEASHAHSLYVGPNPAFAYGCDLGSDCVWIFRFDAAAGTLHLSSRSAVKVAPGAGPRHLAFSHDGKFVYVADELGHTMTVFSLHRKTGDLAPIQVISTLPPGSTDKAAPAEIVLHPNGKWLYVSNRLGNTIAFFVIRPSGRLQLIQDASAGVKTPRSIAIDPSARWIVSAGEDDNHMAVLKIDPATGTLSATTQTAQMPAPVCVLFEPRS